MGRNFVKGQDYVLLIDTIRQMQHEICAGTYTMDTLADFLSQKLGFKITGANVKGAIDSVGLKITRPESKKKDIQALIELVTDLEQRVLDLEKNCGIYYQRMLKQAPKGTTIGGPGVSLRDIYKTPIHSDPSDQ